MRLSADVFCWLKDAGILTDNAEERSALRTKGVVGQNRREVNLTNAAADELCHGALLVEFLHQATEVNFFFEEPLVPSFSNTPHARRSNWVQIALVCEKRLGMQIDKRRSIDLILGGDTQALAAFLAALRTRMLRPMSRDNAQPHQQQAEMSAQLQRRALLDPLVDQVALMSLVLHSRTAFWGQWQKIQEKLVQCQEDELTERQAFFDQREQGIFFFFDAFRIFTLQSDGARKIRRLQEQEYGSMVCRFFVELGVMEGKQRHLQEQASVRQEWVDIEEEERVCFVIQAEAKERKWLVSFEKVQKTWWSEHEELVAEEEHQWLSLVRRLFSYFQTIEGMDITKLHETMHREVLQGYWLGELRGLYHQALQWPKKSQQRKAVPSAKKQEKQTIFNATAEFKQEQDEENLLAIPRPGRKRFNSKAFWEEDVGLAKAETKRTQLEVEAEQYGIRVASEAPPTPQATQPQITPLRSPSIVSTNTNLVRSSCVAQSAVTPRDSFPDSTSLSQLQGRCIPARIPALLLGLQEPLTPVQPCVPPPSEASPPLSADGKRGGEEDEFFQRSLQKEPAPRWFREVPRVPFAENSRVQSFCRAFLSRLLKWALFYRIHLDKILVIQSLWRFRLKRRGLTELRKRDVEWMLRDPIVYNRSIRKVVFTVDRDEGHDEGFSVLRRRHEYTVPVVSSAVKVMLKKNCCTRCVPILLAFGDRAIGCAKQSGKNATTQQIDTGASISQDGFLALAVIQNRRQGNMKLMASMKVAQAMKYTEAMCRSCHTTLEDQLGLSQHLFVERFWAHLPVCRRYFNNEKAVETLCKIQGIFRARRARRIIRMKTLAFFNRFCHHSLRDKQLISSIQVHWRYIKQNRPVFLAAARSARVDQSLVAETKNMQHFSRLFRNKARTRCEMVLEMLYKRAMRDPTDALDRRWNRYEQLLCPPSTNRRDQSDCSINCRDVFEFLKMEWRKLRRYGKWVVQRLKVKRAVRISERNWHRELFCSPKCEQVLELMRRSLEHFPGKIFAANFHIFERAVCKRSVLCKAAFQRIYSVAVNRCRVAQFVRLRFAYVSWKRDQAHREYVEHQLSRLPKHLLAQSGHYSSDSDTVENRRFTFKQRDDYMYCQKCLIFIHSLRQHCSYHVDVSQRRIDEYVNNICLSCRASFRTTLSVFLEKRFAAQLFTLRYRFILHWRNVQKKNIHTRTTRGSCSRCQPILAVLHQRVDFLFERPMPEKEYNGFVSALCDRCVVVGRAVCRKYVSLAESFAGSLGKLEAIRQSDQHQRDAALVQACLRTKTSVRLVTETIHGIGERWRKRKEEFSTQGLSTLQRKRRVASKNNNGVVLPAFSSLVEEEQLAAVISGVPRTEKHVLSTMLRIATPPQLPAEVVIPLARVEGATCEKCGYVSEANAEWCFNCGEWLVEPKKWIPEQNERKDTVPARRTAKKGDQVLSHLLLPGDVKSDELF